MRKALIIGGGISGLSTAYHLAKAGISSTLVERDARLGGVIRTEVVDGCVLEQGPDSFISIKPWAMELIRELGLQDQVIGSNDHLRVTYVLRKGRLLPLPDGLQLIVPTRIMPMVATRLLGWPTKIRMGLEWFRGASNGTGEDRSVADFIRDHYGQEAVDYLAEPLLAGVYGGTPEKLSVGTVLPKFVELEAKYGSLTRGVLAERRRAASQAKGAPLFQTLKCGLGDLIAALIRAIGPRMEVVQGSAVAIERTPEGFRTQVDGGWLESANVVIACQAYQAGALVAPIDPELAKPLAAIPYNSSLTVALGFRESELPQTLHGFGFLVPRRERRRVIACTWVGTKFPHRVPDGAAVFRVFLGGEDAAILDETDDALVALVRDELRQIMGVTATPLFARIARWPRSMAQYTTGHAQRVREIESRLCEIPGLYLAGNAYYGIGIPDCVRMGKQAAERIAGKKI
jgi:oxygen-dependent protoporphyrinogen oxidase